MVQAVVWPIVLTICLRWRILWKQDLETAEICFANDRFLSKMTSSCASRINIWEYDIVRWMVGLLSLESCCRSKDKKLSSRRIRYKKMEDIQLDTLVQWCSPRGQALASRILEDTNLCPWPWPRGFRALDFGLDYNTVYHKYSCKLEGLNL